MDDTKFRAGVGLLVIDDRGEVLAIERTAPRGAWQLPQGGIERGETSERAAYRELCEETGLRVGDVELLAELPVWLGYELPPEHRSAKTGRGQAQRWYAFRLIAGAGAIALPAGGEAAAHRFMPIAELIARTVPFRRPLYEMLRACWAVHLS